MHRSLGLSAAIGLSAIVSTIGHCRYADALISHNLGVGGGRGVKSCRVVPRIVHVARLFCIFVYYATSLVNKDEYT